jgi:hypothetical protein
MRQLIRLAVLSFWLLGGGLISTGNSSGNSIAANAKPSGQAAEREVVLGEPLGKELKGPSVVEGLDAVLRREREGPPEGFDPNPKDRGDAHGQWAIPSRGASGSAHSGEKYVTNKFGDTRMGIGFGSPVRVHGFWIAGQAAEGVWPSELRVLGYRAGDLRSSTVWSESVGGSYLWLELGFEGVDRIVIEAKPRVDGAAWYALDDLSFSIADSPGGRPVVLGFEELPFGANLTAGDKVADYGGLRWEEGTGDFGEKGVPAPVEPPGYEGEKDLGPDGGAAPEGSATAPILSTNFGGVVRGDGGSNTYPPDTCGAVGPNHFVVAVNRNIAVYDKATGTELLNVLSTSFMPGSNGDPRVLYDQYENRWAIIISDFNTRIYLAYSLTSDPLGSFFKTSFVASTGADAGCFPDYPTLGIDQNGIYTSAYMVGCGMSIFAVDKAPLLNATPSLGLVKAFRGLSFEGAIQPCQTFGDSGGELFVSRIDSDTLRLRQLVGPLSLALLQTVGDVAVPVHSDPPNADALGSSTPLNVVGTRLMNAVYRDGSVYTAHCVGVGGRAACRWYQVDGASAALLQSGTISDPVLHYFFPGIAVNALGDLLVGFSGSSASQFAGAYATGRRATDTPGLMAAPALLKAGNAAQNNIDSFGRNRWGDYSLSTLDPSDEVTMWTIQEYAEATNIWGTWVGRYQFQDAPSTYCTGKTNSLGCVPFITTAGTASATSPDPFQVLGNDFIPGEIAFLLYAFKKTSLDFHGGTLCVKAPFQRLLPPKTPVESGVPPCSGVVKRDFNNRIQSGNDPMLSVGQTTFSQWVQRDPADPAGFGDSLSNGVQFVIGP